MRFSKDIRGYLFIDMGDEEYREKVIKLFKKFNLSLEQLYYYNRGSYISLNSEHLRKNCIGYCGVVTACKIVFEGGGRFVQDLTKIEQFLKKRFKKVKK